MTFLFYFYKEIFCKYQKAVAGRCLQLYKKEIPTQVFLCEFW